MRALTSIFFVGTTLYTLVTASAFAYHQFIRPGLFPWLAAAARNYPFLLLGVTSMTHLALLPDLGTRRFRSVILPFVIATFAAALTLLAFPGFGPHGEPTISLALGALALVPASWLAAIDHVVVLPLVFNGRTEPAPSESRLFPTAAAAGGIVWALYASIALANAGTGAFGVAWVGAAVVSLLVHLTAFTAIAWVLAAIRSLARMTAHPGWVEYAGAVIVMTAWLFVLLHQSLLPALALRGVAPTLVAALLALTIAASWSGIALRLAATDANRPSGLALFFRPVTPAHAPKAATIRLLVAALLAPGFIRAVSPMDWGFLLQKSSVLIIWLVIWGAVYAMSTGTPEHAQQTRRAVRTPSRRLAVILSLLLVSGFRALNSLEVRAASGAIDAPQVTASLDRYAAFDMSFKVLDAAVAGRADASPGFYRFLSAHANIDRSIAITPKTLDLGPLPIPPRRPDIFLFVIDSLRRDYVSAYNPSVSFTPHIAAFAAESLVFRNAFSRYGGTGLAVPSIFSGSCCPTGSTSCHLRR